MHVGLVRYIAGASLTHMCSLRVCVPAEQLNAQLLEVQKLLVQVSKMSTLVALIKADSVRDAFCRTSRDLVNTFQILAVGEQLLVSCGVIGAGQHYRLLFVAGRHGWVDRRAAWHGVMHQAPACCSWDRAGIVNKRLQIFLQEALL